MRVRPAENESTSSRQVQRRDGDRDASYEKPQAIEVPLPKGVASENHEDGCNPQRQCESPESHPRTQARDTYGNSWYGHTSDRKQISDKASQSITPKRLTGRRLSPLHLTSSCQNHGYDLKYRSITYVIERGCPSSSVPMKSWPNRPSRPCAPWLQEDSKRITT